jgi:hypothetical protein
MMFYRLFTDKAGDGGFLSEGRCAAYHQPKSAHLFSSDGDLRSAEHILLGKRLVRLSRSQPIG